MLLEGGSPPPSSRRSRAQAELTERLQSLYSPEASSEAPSSLRAESLPSASLEYFHPATAYARRKGRAAERAATERLRRFVASPKPQANTSARLSATRNSVARLEATVLRQRSEYAHISDHHLRQQTEAVHLRRSASTDAAIGTRQPVTAPLHLTNPVASSKLPARRMPPRRSNPVIVTRPRTVHAKDLLSLERQLLEEALGSSARAQEQMDRRDEAQRQMEEMLYADMFVHKDGVERRLLMSQSHRRQSLQGL